jgi:RHS repeat-associated protein
VCSSDLGGDSSETLTVNGASRVRRYSEERQESTRTTPAGRTLTLAVDDQGRVTGARAAGRHPVQIAHDDAGRIARITAGTGPDQRAIVVAHGETDLTITDAAKRVTRLELDAMGRLVRRTAPGGAETRLVRDAKGNVEQVVAPGGATHRFEYSPADRPTAYLPPGAPAERYAYDRDGHLTGMTVGGTKAVGIEYDAAGRRSALTTPYATLRYQYDATSGHLRTVTAADGAAMALEHDGPLLTGIAWSGPVRGRVARGYDHHLRVASVAVDGGGSYAIGYDADGLAVRAGDLSVERDPATGAVSSTVLGVVTTRETRNLFGEVTRIEAAAAGRPLLAIVYERDAGGRIVSRTETTPAGRRATRYAYDPAGRLAEVRAEGTPAVSFAYDADGNRASPGGPARKYAALEHDALGALRRATLADGRVIEYLLDGANRRIGKRIAGAVVDGLLYRDALRPAARVDAAGKVGALFVHATRVNAPDAMIAGGAAYRIVTDELGSPRLVVEAATGKVVQEMDYDAFGNVTRDTSPGFQPFGFAGGLLDRDTGLVHFGARDYDPALGRFTSRDPLGFAAGTTNLHEYAANDPVNRSDPRGLQDDDPFGIFEGPNWSDPSQTTIVEIDTAGNVHVVSPPDQPGPMDVPVDGGPAPGPSRLDKVIDFFRNGAPFLGGKTKLGQPRDRYDRGDTAPGMYCDPWTGETRPQNATDLPGTPATGGATARWVF